ncbi:MAG: serine/threonine protein kinase [Chloroflexi bacterium]|nr:serine/threonine protein kinase [Chloroflexota bacterium]
MKGAKLYRDHYTLEEHIASGGFADIYRASEVGRNEPIAIKICAKHDDVSYSRSIIKEAELLRKFNHRSIIKLHPIPRPDKASVTYANAIELPQHPVFFVMEYLNGGSLEDYLQEVGTLSPPEAATIALEVARALDHIHLKGYAHNDLKLENIVFREPVQAGKMFMPVLLDFGIATRVLPPQGGTLYIMSPEQLPLVSVNVAPERMNDVDQVKIDVWGLGVVLYRMLGGKLPFSGRNTRSLTAQIKVSRPTSLREFSRQITAGLDEMVIDGCLAKDPNHRLSLLDLGIELRKVAGPGVPAQKSGHASSRKSKWMFWSS